MAEKETEPSLLSSLLDEPLFVGIGGGGLFLLGVAGWMVWRRRQEAGVQADSLLAEMEEKEQDTSFHTTSSEPIPSSITSTAGVEVAESSFLSEFTPSDFDILETENDAVDPIAEADVYLAYGRYQQAEELIKHALEDAPENPELRLKLLEIYYANEAGPQFEAFAKELKEAGASTNAEFWGKVVEMGRELCPDSSLFVPGESSGQESDPAASHDPFVNEDPAPDEHQFVDLDKEKESSEEDLFDLDFNQVGQTGEHEQGFPDSNVSGDESLETERVEETDHSLDFDLGDLNLDTEGEESLVEDPKEQPQDFDNGLEFTTFSQESAATTEQQDAAEDVPTQQETLSGEEFDLTDMDELDTKLDLARAYVDMEDVDAARDILEEILERGNENQKQEAQALLDKLRLAS